MCLRFKGSAIDGVKTGSSTGAFVESPRCRREGSRGKLALEEAGMCSGPLGSENSTPSSTSECGIRKWERKSKLEYIGKVEIDRYLRGWRILMMEWVAQNSLSPCNRGKGSFWFELEISLIASRQCWCFLK